MSEVVVYRAKVKGGELTLDDGPTRLFPWWSFTKTVLCTCALQLVAQGRLRLDGPLPGRRYTLRQLLQHRAGIPNYGQLSAYHEAVERGDTPWTLDQLLDRVGAEKLDFAPGTGWAYSNVGYLIVRQIIEKVADADISAVMRRLVFDPLGLRSVKLARTPDDLDGTAWGNRARYHPGWVYHGFLIGSAADAVRFLQGLMSGRLLAPDILDEMKVPHLLGGSVPGRPWETAGYGLGLMIGRMSGAGLAIGHSGNGPVSVGAVYYFPESSASCVAAAFTSGDNEGVAEHEVARLATP